MSERIRPAGWLLAAAAAVPLALAGCSGGDRAHAPAGDAQTNGPAADGTGTDIGAERIKLAPEDRALVDAQEWCAVNTDERLGSMGPPVKVVVKGEPVFVCCKGCEKKALADPDKTLATVADLKARARAEKATK